MPTGIATFGASSQTGITFANGSSASVASIDFVAGAAAFTLTFAATSPATPTLSISGAGVSNASSNAQRFVVAAASASRDNPQLAFTNSATAGGSGMQYFAGPTNPSAPGGGVIRFYNTSTAGSASFTVTTGSGTPPSKNSTVGGEVTFSQTASAGSAQFTIYGSTSTTDGDTFGNVVFHDSATAAQGVFTNIGATVAKGDGGNTQFYDTANAGNGLFHNRGATVAKGNGGDVAFDGTATASSGHFHNYASTAAGGNGGVTSFNNNSPAMSGTQGSSAGQGHFFSYGANAAGQGGGHVFFTAKYGSPTAAKGTFVNYGSAVTGTNSSVGRTVFSITLPQPAAYTPNAGNATFWNLPGTSAGAPGGLTEFTVYTNETASKSTSAATKVAPATSHVAKGAKLAKVAAVNSTGPNAGSAAIVNLGATTQGANGGQTIFSGASGVVSSAANAQLVATGGTSGGYGGKILFLAGSSGGSATVGLSGNGTLDVSGAGQPITIAAMNTSGGVIVCTLGSQTTGVVVTGKANVMAPVAFTFIAGQGFAPNTPYTILTAPNLSSLSTALFSGNSVGQNAPTFSIVGNSLRVSFGSTKAARQKGRRSRS